MTQEEVPKFSDTVDVDGFVEFVDPSFVQWRVSERDARRDPGAKADICLIFACAGMVRRVWDYPSDWRKLSAAELILLSLRR